MAQVKVNRAALQRVAERFEAHAARLERYADIIADIIGDLSRSRCITSGCIRSLQAIRREQLQSAQKARRAARILKRIIHRYTRAEKKNTPITVTVGRLDKNPRSNRDGGGGAFGGGEGGSRSGDDIWTSGVSFTDGDGGISWGFTGSIFGWEIDISGKGDPLGFLRGDSGSLWSKTMDTGTGFLELGLGTYDYGVDFVVENGALILGIGGTTSLVSLTEVCNSVLGKTTVNVSGRTVKVGAGIEIDPLNGDANISAGAGAYAGTMSYEHEFDIVGIDMSGAVEVSYGWGANLNMGLDDGVFVFDADVAAGLGLGIEFSVDVRDIVNSFKGAADEVGDFIEGLFRW
ncbi:MAG: hypothetical protein Q4C01_04445 [Clostridia bacterium]|nr:hypothetical protein [Clostridia bacterium]